MKRNVAESVPDRARDVVFEAISAPEQYCSAPLLKVHVERSVSDRFLKQFQSCLNTLIGEEIATEPRFRSKGSFANCMTDRAPVHTGNASEQFCTATEHQFLFTQYRSNF